MKGISVNIYSDEIKESKYKNDITGTNEKWTYIGLLIVPESIEQRLFYELRSRRCLSDPPQDFTKCNCNCPYHKKNNTEVHYAELEDQIKYQIASKWIDFLLENNKQNLGYVYFYILGINLTNLDLERFGPSSQQDRHTTIYNRFFRTALLKSLKYYFSDYSQITIKNIYHDEGNHEYHTYFPWHSLYFIDKWDNKVSCFSSEINFISSDHRQEKGHPIHSHFIQFIDIILGATFNCLHYSSYNKHKIAIAEKIYDLIWRLIYKPNNKNSSFNYHRKQSIDFFTVSNFNEKNSDDVIQAFNDKKRNQFYSKRELLIERKWQKTIFDFM